MIRLWCCFCCVCVWLWILFSFGRTIILDCLQCMFHSCMFHSLCIDLCEEIMHVCIKSSLYIFIPRPLSNPSATFKRPPQPSKGTVFGLFSTRTRSYNIQQHHEVSATSYDDLCECPLCSSSSISSGLVGKYAQVCTAAGLKREPSFHGHSRWTAQVEHSHHSNHINKCCPRPPHFLQIRITCMFTHNLLHSLDIINMLSIC